MQRGNHMLPPAKCPIYVTMIINERFFTFDVTITLPC